MEYKKDDEYRETKKTMRIIGIILIILGGGALIYGLLSMFKVFTSFPAMGTFESSGANFMGTFFIAAISIFFGFTLIGFGSKLFLATHIRGVSKYMATETSPAMTISTRALATGLAEGLKDGGGLNLAGGDKEVIRIKCRNCGYLETEDATFCSKCGAKI